jgi:geranylgeranyl diphosphate synthase, type I
MTRLVEEVRYPSEVDIRTEFTQILADIESEMSDVLNERGGHARPLYEMLAYHLGLDGEAGRGGKRLRPLLGVLAYQSLGGDYRKALPGAAAVELGHNFSLVHDDIEDADRERRHRPTLWALWGVPLAINAGDALFALSRLALYRLLDKEEHDDRRVLDLMRIYDETCLALCEGQYLDISFERRDDVTVEAYVEMIGKKTAALLGASVQAGAMLASDDPDVVEAYRRFGYDLGMAFQMADDVKGSFWTSDETGKPEAGDIRRRKKTLPVVWALERATDADRARLVEIYAHGIAATDGRVPPTADRPMTDAEVSEVLAILERSGARRQAEAEARRYRDLALGHIAHLPCPDEGKRSLTILVQSVIAA